MFAVAPLLTGKELTKEQIALENRNNIAGLLGALEKESISSFSGISCAVRTLKRNEIPLPWTTPRLVSHVMDSETETSSMLRILPKGLRKDIFKMLRWDIGEPLPRFQQVKELLRKHLEMERQWDESGAGRRTIGALDGDITDAVIMY